MLKFKSKTTIILAAIFTFILLIVTLATDFVSGLAFASFTMLPILLIVIIIKLIKKQSIKPYLIAMAIFLVFSIFVGASKSPTELEMTTESTTIETTTETTTTTTETTTTTTTTTETTTTTTTEITTAAPVYTDTSSQGSAVSSSANNYTADTNDSYSDDTRYVYIGQTGNKYHRESCSTLKGHGIRITYDEAISQGRGACKRCKP